MGLDTPTAAPDNSARNRRRRLIVLWAIALSVIGFATFSNYGVITRIKLERRKTALADSLNSLQQLRDSLGRMSSRLRYDTLEIERIAREKYGMTKPGEQVFIVRKEGEK